MNIIPRTIVAVVIFGLSLVVATNALGQSRAAHDRSDRLERMVERFDADGDGAIDLAEFTTAAVDRFERADTDGDGVVTASERQAARQARHQRLREHAVERFGEDRVRDRFAGESGAGLSGDDEAHGARFEEIDRNGDGAIDRVELDASTADQFARLDADGDGRLSPADRDARRQRVRDCVRGE